MNNDNAWDYLQPEPFYVKSVVPIRQISAQDRRRKLEEAKYNLFNLASDDVFIDLLTDSGTGAMSHNQWAALMRGDEAYAGSLSFKRLRNSIEEIFGFEHVLPTHQGRSAELVLMTHFISAGDHVLNNIHFDTTAAHVQYQKGHDINLVHERIYDMQSEHPFKGNMDTAKLERYLREHGEKVPLVCHTLTCNSGGGQPVSLENVKRVGEICRQFGKPFLIDSARVMENAWFIQQREQGYSTWSIEAILREIMDQSNGMWMSAKKNGLVNMGGFIAVRERELYESLRTYEILFDGFSTYGGMSGRDMDALAQGLHECCSPDYLAYRTGQVAHLCCQLRDNGVGVTWPPGGHAVYVDATDFCSHLTREQFPAQALSLALYLEGGVRSVEIGSVLRGRDSQSGEDRYEGLDLVRLAIPHRTYSYTQLEFVASTLIRMRQNHEQIRGVRFVKETPVLRHFTSEFALI
jgi:tryptophanase